MKNNPESNTEQRQVGKMTNNLQGQKINIGTWFLGIYLIFAPLDFLPIIEGLSFSKLLISLPIAGNIIYLKNYKIHMDKFLIIPILYIMASMLSIFYSVNVSDTTDRIITLSLNIGTALFLSLRSYNAKEILFLKKSIVYSGWVTLFLALIYSDTNIMSGRLTIIVNGYYQDPNYLTGFLIFAITYYFDDYMQLERKNSVAKMIIFLVFILLTGSRGGLLAVIGTIIFHSITLSTNKRHKLLAIVKIIAVIVFLGVLYGLIINVLPENIASRYTYESIIGSGGTGRVRFEIWRIILYRYNILPVFNKVFGNGAGTVRYFAFDQVAHNIWIENLIEIGLFGTFIFFIYYYVYVMKSIKDKEYVVASSFIGYIIMGMSMSLYSYKPIWNVLLLILIIKNHGIKNNANKRGIIYRS